MTSSFRVDGQLYYNFNCSTCNCDLKVRSSYLSKHSGKCRSCTQKKLPYFSIYRAFCSSSKARGIDVSISFEDFLVFVNTKECHYCGTNIDWEEYRDPKTTSYRYFLDRKSSDLSYSASNLVVCCTLCNLTKSDKFTYEEFLRIGKIIGEIKNARS